MKSIAGIKKNIDKFHSMGIRTVVLSSIDICTTKNDTRQLLSIVSSVQDNTKPRQIYSISITRKEGTFIGTGDMFAALFLAWFTKSNFNAKETLEKVIATIQAIIDRTSTAAKTLPGGVSRPGNIELKIVQSRNDIIVPPVSIVATPVLL